MKSSLKTYSWPKRVYLQARAEEERGNTQRRDPVSFRRQCRISVASASEPRYLRVGKRRVHLDGTLEELYRGIVLLLQAEAVAHDTPRLRGVAVGRHHLVAQV